MADVDARLNCTLSLIAAAEASSQEQRDDWEQLASLATSMGGLEVGGHARRCKAYYASTVLNCWPELQRTSSMLQGISITDASYPMLAECCTAYEAYRTQRNAIEAIYDEYAE